MAAAGPGAVPQGWLARNSCMGGPSLQAWGLGLYECGALHSEAAGRASSGTPPSAQRALHCSPTPCLSDCLAQDWVVDPQDVEFCCKPDGSYQELGSGGFGTVRGGAEVLARVSGWAGCEAGRMDAGCRLG